MKVGNRLVSIGTLQQWLVSVSSRSNDTRMRYRHREAFAIEWVEGFIISYNTVDSEIIRLLLQKNVRQNYARDGSCLSVVDFNEADLSSVRPWPNFHMSSCPFLNIRMSSKPLMVA